MKTKIIDVQKEKTSKFVIRKPERVVLYIENYNGELEVDIQCEGAQVYIFGVYVGKGDDVFDIRTIQRHTKGKSMSDLYVKCVLYDEAKFTYEGLIDIAKNAQQSNAYQQNKNLILSDKAYVDSRPFLEIKANDVRCTHGSTTGRLDADQMQYVISRGVHVKEAEKLLVQGFVNDVKQRMYALR